MSTQIQWTRSESLSVASTAVVRPTRGTAQGATYAFITCETAPVRFWLDRQGPTTTVGHRLLTDDTLELESEEEILGVGFIAESTTATLSVSYGKKVPA